MKLLFRFYIVASLLAISVPCLALNPEVVKLTPPTRLTSSVGFYGYAMAGSEKYLVVGETLQGHVAAFSGAVHVYDARTLRLLRTLKAPTPETNAEFGAALALFGDRLLVGAPGASFGKGAVYHFDLRKGRLINTLGLETPVAGDRYGSAVVIADNVVAIGAPGHSSNRGAVQFLLMDAAGTIGDGLTQIPGDTLAGDRFGSSLATNGSLIVAGAPDHNGARGAVYAYDAKNAAFVIKFSASAPAVNELFGSSVALRGQRLLVGAPGANSGRGRVEWRDVVTQVTLGTATVSGLPLDASFGGSVALLDGTAVVGASRNERCYLVDLFTGDVWDELVAADSQSNDRAGFAVAVAGSVVAVGAIREDDVGPDAGAVYVYRNVADRLGATSVTGRNHFVPGVSGAKFSRFTDMAISVGNDLAFKASITGSTVGDGVWTRFNTDQTLRRSWRRGESRTDLLGNPISNSSTGLIFNQPSFSVWSGPLRGAGVTRLNNRALMIHRTGATSSSPLLRIGETQPALGGATLKNFSDYAQTHNVAFHEVAVNYQLTPGGAITTANDTGVVVLNEVGGTIDSTTMREGGAGPDGRIYGQFLPQVGYGRTSVYFIAYSLRLGVIAQTAMLQTPAGGNLLAFETGDAAPGVLDRGARTLLGVTAGRPIVEGIVRATLTPTRDRTQPTEGIWSTEVGGAVALNRTQVPTLATDVKWNRFLGFFPASENGIILHATVSGPGINSRNDGVVMLRQSNGTWVKLMQEGDSAGDASGARIGVIRRVEVHPEDGSYAILASLTGSAASNLGWFKGWAIAGDATTLKPLRRPTLTLRKGSLVQGSTGGVTTIKSFLQPLAVLPGGAGGTGHAQTVAPGGNQVMAIEFANRAVEMFTGKF
ncbi:MAG: FG-GAP repeat protein [Verrucomicrobiales bacterium]|nr:FG-GAP repeat protein [Verrucomicrobiales bacterium]MCP5558636.1 FG-GAP repeat protein [Verrucomicrobiaceae bacterium]